MAVCRHHVEFCRMLKNVLRYTLLHSGKGPLAETYSEDFSFRDINGCSCFWSTQILARLNTRICLYLRNVTMARPLGRIKSNKTKIWSDCCNHAGGLGVMALTEADSE